MVVIKVADSFDVHGAGDNIVVYSDIDINNTVTSTFGNPTGHDWNTVYGTTSIDSTGGNIYEWDILVGQLDNDAANFIENIIGVSIVTTNENSFLTNGVSIGWGYNQQNGEKIDAVVGSAYGASYAPGDLITVVLNLDLFNISFRKNGVSQGIAFSGLPNGAGINYKLAISLGDTPDTFRLVNALITDTYLESILSTINSNIASNSAAIVANTANIATNTSNIATNTSNIAANTSAIAAHTTAINALAVNARITRILAIIALVLAAILLVFVVVGLFVEM